MMNTKSLPFLTAVLALLAFSAAACFRVHVIEDCRDAEARFRSAHREVSRLQASNPGRHGRARELFILVHNRQDDEVVQVRTSLALVKTVLSLGADIAEDSGDFEFEEKYGIAWRQVRDLGRFGPGLLIEVEDEESRVLVWMK